MISIYDRGYNDSTLIRNIAEYAGRAPDPQVCEERQHLRACEIAIVHDFREDWERLIEEYSCPNSVRVRVSNHGFRRASHPEISKDGVYMFHLVPPMGQLQTEWRDILDGLSDKEIVKALVRGEDPNGLKRFFVP